MVDDPDAQGDGRPEALVREGLILAGGRSTRFGASDKAVAELNGVPMIRRVADRVGPVVDRLAITCRDEQIESIREALAGVDVPVDYRPDEEPDRGPLAGIATGLGEDGTDTFLAACDMPFLDPPIVDHLFERVSDHEAAIPVLDDWIQPLHATYRTAAMREATMAARAAGEDRIAHAIDRMDATMIPAAKLESVGSLDSFENVNTRAEFERAADRLSSSGHQHR